MVGNVSPRIVTQYPYAYLIHPGTRTLFQSSCAPKRSAGDIKFFSAASRRRLISAIAKRPFQFTHFLTITSPLGLQDHKRELLKGIRYFASKHDIFYVWVVEAHQSGKLHVHMLVHCTVRKLLLFKSYLRKLIQYYQGSIDYTDRMVTAKPLRHWGRPVVYYLAKYMTKVGDADIHSFQGRRWGRNYRDAVVCQREATETELELGSYLDWHCSKYYPGASFSHLIADWDYAQYPPAVSGGSCFIVHNDEGYKENNINTS